MRNEFFGWYFKCQSPTQTLAVIPAHHGGSRSVQLISDDGAWNFSDCGSCHFSRDGFKLDLCENGNCAVGEVKFSPLSPLKYDIMGPFRFVPFMECRHSVLSMRHRVDGEISVNGKAYVFSGALGYIEGDRGTSFPGEYAWTQCFFEGGSLMLSVAEIPLGPFNFTGVICAILLNGKEYRLATYLGARAVKIADGEIVIRQGKYTFTATLIEKNAHPLAAPVGGNMLRIIRESAACRASYKLEKGGKALLDFVSDRASFEYEYGGRNEQTCQ